MKISELEVLLPKIRAKYGNLDVVCVAPDNGGYDCCDEVLTMDMINLGKSEKLVPFGDCCLPDEDRIKLNIWLHIGRKAESDDDLSSIVV